METMKDFKFWDAHKKCWWDGVNPWLVCVVGDYMSQIKVAGRGHPSGNFPVNVILIKLAFALCN